MDETALVKAAQVGDLDSFNRLVLAYQDQAYRLAYRMLSEEDAAEDVTQTAFLSAYRNIHTFRGGSFRAWVLRMVTNACYDELRRRKRRPTQPLEPVTEDDEEMESPSWLADDALSPEEVIEHFELDRAIQHCLAGLPEEFRVVVVLTDVEGMDYQEVAEAIQKPLGTVKSRLARARTRLQNCLRGFAELLPEQYRQNGERYQ